MNTRNVTNTAFTSYPATRVELPNGRQLANSYDALYRRTLVHDATNDVNVAAWQFFGPSRVAEVNLANGLTCTWMNDARTHSGVQPTVANPAWGDQSSDRLGYDGAGRPITKRYLAGGLNGSNGYANPSAVVGFTTEYDLASNKFYERALHAPARSSLYEPFSNGSPTGGYDSLNRLRQYQRGVLTSDDGFAGNGGGSVATPIALPNTDTQRTYDLDSLGDWRRTVYMPEGGSQQTEVRQHNGLNEITRIQTNGGTPINFSYDGVPGHSNGNLANDGTRSYVWDALNRLAEVKRVSDGAVIGQYVYDALNRRIRKTIPDLGGNLGGLTGNIPAGTTDCIYSGWRCIEERNPFGGGGDAPTIQYIWGIYLDELLQQFNIVALNGFSANVALYPMQDLLYRTTGLADSSGTVREAYDTDAYGNTLIFRNSGDPPSAITWIDSGEGADTQVDYQTCPFIFTGQRFDAESRIYYYKWRFFLPSLGRFASKDPLISIEKDCNIYRYCKNSPITCLDPRGLASTFEEMLFVLEEFSMVNPPAPPPVSLDSWECKTPRESPGYPLGGSHRYEHVFLDTCCSETVELRVRATRCFEPGWFDEHGGSIELAKHFYTEVRVQTKVLSVSPASVCYMPTGRDAITEIVACRVMPGRYISYLENRVFNNFKWPQINESMDLGGLQDEIGNLACTLVNNAPAGVP